MSHPDLPPTAQDALRQMTPASPEPAGGTEAGPTATPATEVQAAARPSAKARLRAALRPVADPTLDRLAHLVAARLRHAMRSEYDELVVSVELLRAEQSALRTALESRRESDHDGPKLFALETNAELMKGELGAFRAALDDLGQAIAPAAGLPGVPARFAELREQVNALDRRLRMIGAEGPTASTPVAAVTDATEAGDSADFDYVGFERRFRGDSEAVLATLTDRYGDRLAGHQPALDFGCGRGELVGALEDRGIDITGIDPDAGMVAEAQGLGRSVLLGDGIAELRSRPPHSLGAIISVHVAEHLPLPVLVELFELAATRLVPGGILITETPNPMSLIVLGNSYILDPTHVWPLHPSLLTFMAERAGFRDVELEFYSPADGYRMAPVDAGPDGPVWVDQINAAIGRLNEVLFGPQEYALIARTARD